MRELEYKLVHDAVNAKCAAHKLRLRVSGIVEDEIMAIKTGQGLPTNASCKLQVWVSI